MSKANRKSAQFNDWAQARGSYKVAIDSGLHRAQMIPRVSTLILMYDENSYSDKYKMYDVWNYQKSQRKTVRITQRLKYLGWKLLFKKMFNMLLILEREEERGTLLWETSHSCPSQGLNLQPRRVPWPEMNPQPFVYRTMLQPTKPHWPGLETTS